MKLYGKLQMKSASLLQSLLFILNNKEASIRISGLNVNIYFENNLNTDVKIMFGTKIKDNLINDVCRNSDKTCKNKDN